MSGHKDHLPWFGLALAICLLTVWLLTGPGRAEEPTGEPRGLPASFGNTVLSVYPDGRTQTVWMDPDGAWTGVTREHRRVGGRWRMKGEKVCLRQTKPPTLPVSFCTSFPSDVEVGSAWSSKDLLGTPVELRLLPGRPFANVAAAPPAAAAAD